MKNPVTELKNAYKNRLQKPTEDLIKKHKPFLDETKIALSQKKKVYLQDRRFMNINNFNGPMSH